MQTLGSYCLSNKSFFPHFCLSVHFDAVIRLSAEVVSKVGLELKVVVQLGYVLESVRILTVCQYSTWLLFTSKFRRTALGDEI